MEQTSDKDKALAFRSVIGLPGKRSREQEIVYQEICGQFRFFPVFRYAANVGMDTHLAAVQSGKVELAKTVEDLLTVDMKLLAYPEPEVTKEKDNKQDDS
jgi:hypothetical protein